MIGLAVRPHIVENHRLVCGACRDDWRKIDSHESWYGVCANCGSNLLVVEAVPIPGITSTEWELACDDCGATWTGMPDDSCQWCERAIEIQLEHQVQLLPAPPDIHPDDINLEVRMDAWNDRLVNGVEAGLITERQADSAWRRATGPAAA